MAAQRRVRGTAARVALASGLLTCAAPTQEVEYGTKPRTTEQVTTTLSRIDVSTRDVFADEAAEVNFLYWLANFLHFTTDPEVVRRELWFHVDESVNLAEIEELERNLRSLRLFGEVRTTLKPVDEDHSELEIWTRDKFSLIVSASLSSVGGVTSYRGELGESNLAGSGKKIKLSGQKDDQDSSLVLQYEDPQLFGGWYHAVATVGDTTEGTVAALQVFKPFKHLTDPWSHGGSIGHTPARADYYAEGETVAEVPLDSYSASLFAAHGFGPRDRRASVGVDVAWASVDYQMARGPAAGSIRVPGDTDEVQLGLRGTLDWADEYRKLQNLDTLDYVQDIQLGVVADGRVGGAYRDEEGAGAEFQPLISGRVRAAVSPFDETYFTFEVQGSSRFSSGESVAWENRVALHGYQQSLPAQTLAFALRHDAAESRQGLPRQLTLGEDNGLRGYPARQFTGSRMTVLNLEDRIATGLSLFTIHLGAVAFADFGWPGGDSPDAGQLYRSVGVGLRIGSSNLFGSNAFRLDAAWPLDDQNGQTFNFSLSFAAGQVFSFFGHATGLTDDVVGLR